MLDIDIRIPKNMFSSILPPDDLIQPISLNLILPYLDYIFNEVNPEYVPLLLEVSFSSMLKRHSGPPLNRNTNKLLLEGLIQLEDSSKFIDECNDYESLETDMTILGIVEHELAENIIANKQLEKQINFYSQVIDRTITLLTEELITNPIQNVETQLSILLNCFEKFDRIIINNYKYDLESHRLWLVISG